MQRKGDGKLSKILSYIKILSKLCPKPIKTLSKLYPNPIKMYPNSIQILSKHFPNSIQTILKFYQISSRFWLKTWKLRLFDASCIDNPQENRGKFPHVLGHISAGQVGST